MDAEAKQRMMASPGFRVLRWIVPWVALAIIVGALWTAYGQFKLNAKEWERASAEQTGTLGSVATTMTGTVVTLIDGLNMRDSAGTEGLVLVKLPKGTTLVVFELRDGWYRVKAPNGREGWVSANAQYTSTLKK